MQLQNKSKSYCYKQHLSCSVQYFMYFFFRNLLDLDTFSKSDPCMYFCKVFIILAYNSESSFKLPFALLQLFSLSKQGLVSGQVTQHLIRGLWAQATVQTCYKSVRGGYLLTLYVTDQCHTGQINLVLSIGNLHSAHKLVPRRASNMCQPINNFPFAKI